jgi:hypothetical protein
MAAGHSVSTVKDGNIYKDVSGLMDDFLGLEASLVVFVQSLVDGSDRLQGGDMEAEVAAAVQKSCFPNEAAAAHHDSAFKADGQGQHDSAFKAAPASSAKDDEAAQFVASGSGAGGGEEGADNSGNSSGADARGRGKGFGRRGAAAEAQIVNAALNWMGISSRQKLHASLKTWFADAKSVLAAKSQASVAQDMSLAYYMLLESMCDVLVMPQAVEKRYRDLLVEGGLEPASEVARVEVMGKENLVNVLYFPIPLVVAACWDRPEVDHIRTQILYPDDMRWRGNAEEKMKNFLDEAEELIDVMDHEFKLLEMRAGKKGRFNQLVAIIAQQYWEWSAMQLLLTLVLNVLLLSFMAYDADGREILGQDNVYRWPVHGYLLDKEFGYFNSVKYAVASCTTLPSLHLVCAFLTLLSYSVSMGQRRVQSGLSQNPRNVLRVGYSTKQARMVHFALKHVLPNSLLDGLTNLVGRVIVKAADAKVKSWKGDEDAAADSQNAAAAGADDACGHSANASAGEKLPSLFGNSSQRGMAQVEVTLPRWFWVARYYFVDPNETRPHDWRALYHVGFLGLSAAGFLYSPLVYVACMADVMRVSPTMRYIGRSLTKNLDQVMITMVFMLLLLYFFAAMGFQNNYSYDFENHDGCREGYDPKSDDEASCGGDFSTWLRLHVDYGVINPMVWNDVDGPVSTVSGSIFGFVYYFFINLVITAIVSGIIIDTFAEMRVNRQAVAEDLRTSCFVCNIEREDFEHYGVRYDAHIRDDHNMWKYVWLMVHLREKESVLYTGLEMHVAPLLKAHNNRAMPLKKSRAIQGKKINERATLPIILSKVNGLGRFSSQLAKQMSQLFDKVNELTSAVEKSSEVSKAAAQGARDEAHRLAAALHDKGAANRSASSSVSGAALKASGAAVDAVKKGAGALAGGMGRGVSSGGSTSRGSSASEDGVEGAEYAQDQGLQKSKSSKRLFRSFRRNPK